VPLGLVAPVAAIRFIPNIRFGGGPRTMDVLAR